MGANGSIVAGQGQCWQIPAVPPAELVDVTGAGNAYCGGFLVGLGEKLGVLEAALYGAVSASFAIQQFGVPDFDAETFSEAKGRLPARRIRCGPGCCL
jgi:sugar/nucleoside kinase (ribokinase family)